MGMPVTTGIPFATVAVFVPLPPAARAATTRGTVVGRRGATADRREATACRGQPLIEPAMERAWGASAPCISQNSQARTPSVMVGSPGLL
ncbi:MAG: hypothetical protein J3K34DRAFT_428604 [Monoraphidium minutum]|nr:MAG: hypothetical protein J3K34DRAFT_428604 [Monoraphidium minutum]